MMVGSGGINGGEGQQQQVAVPPGFRFHPTDEELLYYYLRKKICYEAIDLDVIREVDLNKLEPWDLKERCRIGSGPQNEWYFFSHKDKKYPTGTRTNRATTVGFWKATGRDKAIVQQQSHVASGSSSRRRRRIGMRKTLVFYTGRAPHGQKTDWIMHEYRLLLDDPHPTNPDPIQEEGWVVCRVFKKKNPSRVSSSSLFPPNCHEPAAGEDEEADHEDHQLQAAAHHKMNVAAGENINPKQSSFLLQLQQAHPYVNYLSNSTCSLFGGGTNYNNMINMHLPQLLTSPDHHDHHHPTSSPAAAEAPSIGHTLVMMNNHDHNLDHPVISSSCGCTRAGGGVQPINNVHDHPGPHSQQFTTNGAADWSFLDKLLASSHHQSSTGTGLGHEQGLGLDHHQVSKFNQLQQIIPSNSQPAVILGRDDHHHAPNLSQMFPFQYLGHQD